MPSYDYDVPAPIVPFDQRQTNLCWLASTATLFSWRSPGPIDMPAAANRLGAEFIAKYAAGEALGYDEIPLWSRRAGFDRQGQQCLDARGWDALLRAHGPLITVIDGTGSNAIDHAVTVTGIEGDGGVSTTRLTIVNSQGGVVQRWTLEDFAGVFEAPQGSDALFSVACYPSP